MDFCLFYDYPFQFKEPITEDRKNQCKQNGPNQTAEGLFVGSKQNILYSYYIPR